MMSEHQKFPTPNEQIAFRAGLEAAARWHDARAKEAEQNMDLYKVMTEQWCSQMDARRRHLTFAAAIRALATGEHV